MTNTATQREALIDAARHLARVVEDLGTAYVRIDDLFREIRRGAYRDAGQPGQLAGVAQMELDNAIGQRRLARELVQRLRGAGLGLVLEEARCDGVLRADWIDRFCERIGGVVHD